MKLNHHIRAFLSLVLAYGLVGALFLGSIASGRAAALPSPICSASNVNGSNTAPLSAPRDLTCLVAGCCGIAASGLAPSAPSAVSQPVAIPVIWRMLLLPQRAAFEYAAAEARAPPVSV
ncbi:MAG TPA: hypothetical protein VNQ34_04600 [Xanthobacteraceae bacterium]|nr:hypothetical protein [Xanthobacteraceae bacterium]